VSGLPARVDLAILGGGMGALTASQTARNRGATVALFEHRYIGGT
jgi:pyruvate/2-oxoglutarate dehydrogenase complex dihydrolipoamide dehydrogenase (E3) component